MNKQTLIETLEDVVGDEFRIGGATIVILERDGDYRLADATLTIEPGYREVARTYKPYATRQAADEAAADLVEQLGG